MKDKYLQTYMDMAHAVSKLSYAERKKVGCIIVSPNDLVVYGWNGMPSGWENECERKGSSALFVGEPRVLETKPEVLHAESNALMKAAREGFKLKGSTLFVTCSPCIDCAKLIHQAGIQKVYYAETYRSTEGIDFLHKCGMEVELL